MPRPAPGEGELAVDVDYAGVGFVDTLFRWGEFDLPVPFTPAPAVVPLTEVAGVHRSPEARTAPPKTVLAFR